MSELGVCSTMKSTLSVTLRYLNKDIITALEKEEDGSYRGCLRVHLNLCRPINIVAGTRPPSIYDILKEDRTLDKTLTSFYMPRNAVKAIHITSNTTTREVIVALLRKFKVVDNPQKFALYERSFDCHSNNGSLRRISDSECPLVLAMQWTAEGLTAHRVVLQENDTADIQWDAFSLPELNNFLRILDREEEDYRSQILDKYARIRSQIRERLAFQHWLFHAQLTSKSLCSRFAYL
ncbi:SARAH domain [Trinorchestia longiramus]|nr:SARAH domain [Trinorchestia longiramus]